MQLSCREGIGLYGVKSALGDKRSHSVPDWRPDGTQRAVGITDYRRPKSLLGVRLSKVSRNAVWSKLLKRVHSETNSGATAHRAD